MSKRSRSLSPSSLPSTYHPQSPSPTPTSPPPSTTTSLAPSKLPLLDTHSGPAAEVMRCSLPPHRDTLTFNSYEDYEVHYMQTHVNRCSECGKNFPTDRFLNLHIEENHDPLVAARRDRGEKTYGCFIEDCERKCSTPQKRRMHLVDKHLFPKTYNFYIVNDGIDKQSSMLRPTHTHRRRLSTTPTSPQEGRLRYRQTSISHSNAAPALPPPEPADPAIDQLERSMSALRFVPASVTRNQGVHRHGP